MTQIQNTFGALNSGDLASQMTSFFNSFSTLANNPQDVGQRSIVIQNGVSLANYVQGLRSSLDAIRGNAQTDIQQSATQANNLVQSIASLNGQIAAAEANGGKANTLEDQEWHTALSSLSRLMDIRTIQQPNGSVNVLTGSTPLIQGTFTHPIGTQTLSNPNTDPNSPNTLAPVTQVDIHGQQEPDPRDRRKNPRSCCHSKRAD